MIEPAALLAWSALALIVTLTPGPDTLLVASHGARGGLRAGLAAVAGIMTGVLWYGSLIAFGALSILVARAGAVPRGEDRRRALSRVAGRGHDLERSEGQARGGGGASRSI